MRSRKIFAPSSQSNFVAVFAPGIDAPIEERTFVAIAREESRSYRKSMDASGKASSNRRTATARDAAKRIAQTRRKRTPRSLGV